MHCRFLRLSFSASRLASGLGSHISLCPTSYLSAYADPRCALRRYVRLQLYLDLNLNLNLWSHPALNRAPFQKSFRKPFSSSFRSLQGFKYPSLLGLVNLAQYLQTQPPGQRVGR